MCPGFRQRPAARMLRRPCHIQLLSIDRLQLGTLYCMGSPHSGIIHAGGTAAPTGTAQTAAVGSMIALDRPTARQRQDSAAMRAIMTRDDAAMRPECHCLHLLAPPHDNGIYAWSYCLSWSILFSTTSSSCSQYSEQAVLQNNTCGSCQLRSALSMSCQELSAPPVPFCRICGT